MPVDYYPQRSIESLLTLLDSLQKRSTTGAVFFTTAAGMQTQRSFQNTARVETEIKRVLYSLHLRGKLNEEQGGDANPYPNPYLESIRRTRASYT